MKTVKNATFSRSDVLRMVVKGMLKGKFVLAYKNLINII